VALCVPLALKRAAAADGVELELGTVAGACRTGSAGTGTLISDAVRAEPELGLDLEPVLLPGDLVSYLEPPLLTGLGTVPGPPEPDHSEPIDGAEYRPDRWGRPVRMVRAWWGRWYEARDVVACENRGQLVRSAHVVGWGRDWPLSLRLSEIPDMTPALADELVEAALGDPTARQLGALDAAIRRVTELRHDATIGPRDMVPTLRRLVAHNEELPASAWRLRPITPRMAALLEEVADFTPEEWAAARSAPRDESGSDDDADDQEAGPEDDEPARWGLWVVADLADAILVRKAATPRSA